MAAIVSFWPVITRSSNSYPSVKDMDVIELKKQKTKTNISPERWLKICFLSGLWEWAVSKLAVCEWCLWLVLWVARGHHYIVTGQRYHFVLPAHLFFLTLGRASFFLRLYWKMNQIPMLNCGFILSTVRTIAACLNSSQKKTFKIVIF